MFILRRCSIKYISFSNFFRHSSKFDQSNLKKLLETMPKEQKHIAAAQRQRLKIKEKFQKYVPGKVTLQVLGSGTDGAPKSLYLFTDQSRYLFNCGEGTQRLAHEHKMKLSKLEHIFITHPTWDNIGGLPGVSLTIQDVGVPQITLHGPNGLDELFLATRRFVVLKDLQIRMAECKETNNFEDNVMSVIYVPVTREITASVSPEPEFDDLENEKCTQVGVETVDIETSTRASKNKRRSQSYSQSINNAVESDDDTDYYAHESRKKRRRSRHRRRYNSVSGTRTSPPTTSELSQEYKEQNISMCYICRLNPRPGALSLERCVEAGVPPGPMLGQLKAGKDITLESGVVVKSSDVCLPDDPGPILIVVDCPTDEYINSMVENKVFEKFQSRATKDEDMAYIVAHFTPAKVMQNARYKSWVDKFSPSTQHIAINDGNTCMGSLAVHRIQHKLNMLHSDMFPLLGDCGTGIVNENKGVNTNGAENSTNDSFIHPNTLCNIYLRPKKGVDRSEELRLEPSEYINETLNVEGFQQCLDDLKENLLISNRTAEEFPRILFLGTGSCIPNKTRNTSGILVETSEQSSFLMDCGEGTYGQIIRFYGSEKAKQIIKNLKAVYISHLHADHHIGLVGLLKGRRKVLNDLGIDMGPLMLIAPRQILSWLNFYDRRFENIAEEYELFANGEMVIRDNKLTADQKARIQNELGMKEINTVLVNHCPNAFGVAFLHKTGWKLTYSGDTMPCDRLIDLGTNSDILIHEATMEDELAHEAVSKMHSTTSQAISIGQKMKAKHILLTHFSQRYAKLPRFNDNFAANVGIAFDNMQLRMGALSEVPLLYPALKLMFAEHYEEIEHKAAKRQFRQEREKAS